MRVLIVLLIVGFAAPCFAQNGNRQQHRYTRNEDVAKARAAQIRQETKDNHLDSVQRRQHRTQEQLQQQVYEQQESSRRQRQYSQEQKVQQQRTRRQNETRIIGW